MRLICAPFGYGKKHAAFEYADVVFSLRHVFWIRCESPCFLRDLDERVIASECFKSDDRCRLVVFEGLPELDDKRLIGLLETIDALCAKNVEILITCTPWLRPAFPVGYPLVEIASGDLMLTEDECFSMASARKGFDELPPPPARIPLLAWDDAADSARLFADGLGREAMPDVARLALVSSMVLLTGSMSDLVPVGLDDPGVIERLAREYPHMGVSLARDTFDSVPVELAILSRLFKKPLARLVRNTDFENLDNLARYWASLLLAQGRGDRACEVLRFFCNATVSASWVIEHSKKLARCACALPVIDLVSGFDSEDRALKARVDVEVGFRYVMLGETLKASKAVRHAAFDKAIDAKTRVLACVVVARSALGADQTKACEYLAQKAQAVLMRMQADPRQSRYSNSESFWMPLAQALLFASAGNCAQLIARWRALVEAGSDRDALLLVAAFALELACKESMPSSFKTAVVTRGLADIAAYIDNAVQATGDTPDYFVANALLALDQARTTELIAHREPTGVSSLVAAHHAQRALANQGSVLHAREQTSVVKRANALETNPVSFLDRRYARNDDLVRLLAPMLEVKLFGPMFLSVGDAIIPNRTLRRRRTRVLLALLAVNMNCEMSRDKLITMLWPDADYLAGRKNFYTIWSELRRALVLSDGECPYLVRHQNGYSMDGRVAKSDVQGFEDVCRAMMFDEVESVDWAEVQRRLEVEYRDDFLPDEVENQFVMNLREDYRSRLIEAMIVASGRLVESQLPEYGMWFARNALLRDPLREDAYRALMLAQERSGQRVAAISTYSRCRSMLRDELGLDPSPETSAVYDRLIDA